MSATPAHDARIGQENEDSPRPWDHRKLTQEELQWIARADLLIQTLAHPEFVPFAAKCEHQKNQYCCYHDSSYGDCKLEFCPLYGRIKS